MSLQHLKQFRHENHILVPIISALFATMANGLYTSFNSLQVAKLDLSPMASGFLLSCFFIGLSIGTITTQKIINKYKHSKTYLILCAILTCGLILETLISNFYIWISCRLIIGYASGGTLAIYETWINSFSSRNFRVYALSAYMATYYGALALGQLFLNLSLEYSGTIYFIIIFLTLISGLPFLKAKLPKYPENPAKIILPKLKEIISVANFGCLCSGLISGVILSLLPYLLSNYGYSDSEISLVMTVTLLAGTLPQFFIGYFIFQLSHRKLLSLLGIGLGIVAYLEIFQYPRILVFAGLSSISAAFAFGIYPVCTSMALTGKKFVDINRINSNLLFSYSTGSSIGPLLCSIIMGYIGFSGYFYFLTALALTIIVSCIISFCKYYFIDRITLSSNN